MTTQINSTLSALWTRFGLAPRAVHPSRLQARARALAAPRLVSPAALLAMAEDDAVLQLQLASALTTTESSFFRQARHFEFLAHLMQDRANETVKNGRLRVWSAGCSAGEEAFSVALVAHEELPPAGRARVEIIATDIDALALTQARRGRVSREALAFVAPHLVEKYFPKSGSEHVVAPSVHAMVEFRHDNLLEDAQSMEEDSLDVVFFCNIGGALTSRMRTALWKEFARVLGPHGRLLVAENDPVPDGHFIPLMDTEACLAYRPHRTEADWPAVEYGSEIRSQSQCLLSSTTPPPSRVVSTRRAPTMDDVWALVSDGQIARALTLLDDMLKMDPANIDTRELRKAAASLFARLA